jgi:hypothetical protein
VGGQPMIPGGQTIRTEHTTERRRSRRA